jgi:hypothetical protein
LRQRRTKGIEEDQMNEEFAETVGVEGYIYLYPVVLMDVSRRQLTNRSGVESARVVDRLGW